MILRVWISFHEERRSRLLAGIPSVVRTANLDVSSSPRSCSYVAKQLSKLFDVFGDVCACVTGAWLLLVVQIVGALRVTWTIFSWTTWRRRSRWLRSFVPDCRFESDSGLVAGETRRYAHGPLDGRRSPSGPRRHFTWTKLSTPDRPINVNFHWISTVPFRVEQRRRLAAPNVEPTVFRTVVEPRLP